MGLNTPQVHHGCYLLVVLLVFVSTYSLNCVPGCLHIYILYYIILYYIILYYNILYYIILYYIYYIILYYIILYYIIYKDTIMCVYKYTYP